MSLRRRLTTTLLLTFGSLLGAGGAGIYFWARLTLHREFEEALRVKLQALAAFTKPTHEGLDFEFVRRFQPGVGATAAPMWFEVFDTNGVSLARSPSLVPGALRPPQRAADDLDCWGLSLPDGEPAHAAALRFLAKPPPPRPRPAADTPAPPDARPAPPPVELELVIAESLAPVQAELHSLATVILGTGGVTLLATVALVPWVLRRGLAPLRRLGEQARSMDAASLQARFPTAGLPSDLAPISECLNDLLARLEESFARERRFSADLAHELRTPIAGLRATAEVALKFGDPADREGFESVLELARQMESLVAHLLALARSEQRHLPLQRQPVLVAPLLAELWQPLAARAAERKLRPRLEVPPAAQLHTDPALFRAVLGNLLTNAVEYAAEGGDVCLQWTAQREHFELAVSNTAHGLEAADVARFFDRFWRKDQARHDPSHAGLGLPLARSLAQLLGLELEAKLAATNCIRLRLTGPLNAPATGRGALPN